MNELEKRNKMHKRKQRGLSPFGINNNTDAGNVKHNVAMFNRMNNPIEAPCINPVSGPFGNNVGGEATMGESVGKMEPFLNEELWDSSRVTDLVRYYLDRADITVSKLKQLVIKQMEKEGSKLPLNMKLFDNCFNLAIDEYNSNIAELDESYSDPLDKLRYEFLNSTYTLDSLKELISSFRPVDTLDTNNKDALIEFVISNWGMWNLDYDLYEWSTSVSKSTDQANNISEAIEEEPTIDLYYDDLTIDVCCYRGNPHGYYNTTLGGWLPDENETREETVDYVLTLPREYIFDDLCDICIDEVFTDEEYDKHEDDWDDFVNGYVSTHFDELFKRYESRLLAQYEEKAIEKASDAYYYMYYESMKGGTNNSMKIKKLQLKESTNNVIHTKPTGEYLVVNSSGDGYCAYTKHNVRIGHISADSDKEAISKFTSKNPQYESTNKDYLDSHEFRIQRYEDDIPELFHRAHDNYMSGMLNSRDYADALAKIHTALEDIDCSDLNEDIDSNEFVKKATSTLKRMLKTATAEEQRKIRAELNCRGVYARGKGPSKNISEDKVVNSSKKALSVKNLNESEEMSWKELVELRLDDPDGEFLDDLYSDFSDDAYKIVEAEGYTDVFTEPSIQCGRGRDFFRATKNGVSYSGSYDFETEQDEFGDCCLEANSREEALALCAQRYAEIILLNLSPEDDDYDDDYDDFSSFSYNEEVTRANTLFGVKDNSPCCASCNNTVGLDESYTDESGILGTPGEIYTNSALKNIWNSGKDTDPSMMAYKGDYAAWLKDTIAHMTESFDKRSSIDLDAVGIKVANLLDVDALGEDKWIEFYCNDSRPYAGTNEVGLTFEATGETRSLRGVLKTNKGKIDVKIFNGSEAVCTSPEEIARFIAGEFGINL